MFKNYCKMFYPTSKRAVRWDAIKTAMAEWRQGRPEPKAWNNSLRAYIDVTHRTSTRETPYWGSLTPESTAAICGHFNEILRFAVRKSEAEPRSNSSSGFSKLIILERELEGIGTAKLTVGVKPDGRLVQYSITAHGGEASA